MCPTWHLVVTSCNTSVFSLFSTVELSQSGQPEISSLALGLSQSRTAGLVVVIHCQCSNANLGVEGALLHRRLKPRWRPGNNTSGDQGLARFDRPVEKTTHMHKFVLVGYRSVVQGRHVLWGLGHCFNKVLSCAVEK